MDRTDTQRKRETPNRWSHVKNYRGMLAVRMQSSDGDHPESQTRECLKFLSLVFFASSTDDEEPGNRLSAMIECQSRTRASNAITSRDGWLKCGRIVIGQAAVVRASVPVSQDNLVPLAENPQDSRDRADSFYFVPRQEDYPSVSSQSLYT